MYLVSQEIQDLQKEFEGGLSLDVDWYSKLRLAANNLLDNLNPETLKRVSPIYGGLTRHLQVYYCPPDLEVPSRIYTHDRRTYFDYVPASQFYGRYSQYGFNKFTIEYVNGVRFVVIKHPNVQSTIIIDPMDGTQTISGVALTLNRYNVLPGASASMQGTFTSGSFEVDGTLPAPVDISACLFGVAIIPVYFDSALLVSQLELQLIDGNGNYYDVITTMDSVGNYLRDGQNMVRFWMQHATTSGTPDPTNITHYKLKIPMTSGNSQAVILGKLTVQSSQLFNLEYYSRYLFLDGTTRAWKDTPNKGTDLINLDRDTAGVLHYETAVLVFSSEKFSQSNPGQLNNLQAQLQRKYEQYWEQHPSSAEPFIGTILPDIPKTLDPYYEGYGAAIPERFGEFVDAEQISPQPVYFADAETPLGTFDGVNTVFRLLHVPDPPLSLELILNGVVLTQGIDYTLAANVITFTSPPSETFADDPFLASYRYLVQ
jgi:hypothetical protein